MWIAWAAGTAAMATMVLGLVVNEIATVGHTTLSFERMEWFWKFPLAISTFGIPIGLAIGILDWMLERSAATKALPYAAAVGLVGAVAGFCLLALQSDDPRAAIFGIPSDAAWWAWRIGIFAISGLVGGLTFWALARNARKAPAFWSDVF
jgi:hypothetical protein